jgi:DNA-binding MarR family transcriptional regulator
MSGNANCICTDVSAMIYRGAMKAHDLFRLGRQLTRIAEEAMQSADRPRTPPGVRLILMDIHAEPGSSIGQISARTGLPQSYVSESVARLREQGVLDTSADPADGRRTLVRVDPAIPRAVAKAGAVPVDRALIAAGADKRLIADLDALASRLNERG